MDQVRNDKSLSPKLPLILLILNPETFGLESLAIEEDEVALSILLGPVAQGRDHDIAICQAVQVTILPLRSTLAMPMTTAIGYTITTAMV